MSDEAYDLATMQVKLETAALQIDLATEVLEKARAQVRSTLRLVQDMRARQAER